TKADIKLSSAGKGKITIPFKSEAEFKRILKLVNAGE
ncbi:MAG TPA: chromosome partitioning protein ParB, partial [Flavobacterium sp.]